MRFNWLSKMALVGVGVRGEREQYYFRLHLLKSQLLGQKRALEEISKGVTHHLFLQSKFPGLS